ncbi:MAG: exo-alpha-sialidase [Akkermansiaceae bacterium]|nr:exo-alpha-sialidase [Armatimonadota bacterium]
MIRFISGVVALSVLTALPLSSSAHPGDTPPVIKIAPGMTFADAKEPHVAVGSGGQVYVAFGMGNIVYCAVSPDGGKTYNVPVLVARVQNLSLGMRRGPRVAVAGRSVVISAISGVEGAGKDGDLLAWRSPDQGKSWSGPVRVNDVRDAAREGLHAMTAAVDGTIACTWLDLRNKGTQLYASVSRDRGATWGKNVRVYASPDGTICECCHPSLAFDGKGNLHVMWRNALGGARDMYLAESRDGGKSFGTAQKLGRGTWVLNACPMDGGAFSISPTGTVTTFWQRNGEIFSCQPGSEEKSLGVGRQGWVASTADGPYFVWSGERTGAIGSAPGHTEQWKLARNAVNPVVAAPLTGNGPVVAVWTSRDGLEGTVLTHGETYPGDKAKTP